MFSQFVEETLGLRPNMMDNDFSLEIKKHDAYYYQISLIYVDICLAVRNEIEKMAVTFGYEFVMNENKCGPPTQYLGAIVETF